MSSLEEIASSFRKGMGRGLASAADPVGAMISLGDYNLVGAGECTDRAVPTAFSNMSKLLYKTPDEKLLLGRDYVPRFGGQLIGSALGAAALYAAYTYGGIVTAGALPAVLGIYSIVGTAGKYIIDFFRGEQGKDGRKKASFKEGFRYGYEAFTHPIMGPLHAIENGMTGRGIDNSHFESSLKISAGKMKRNFAAIAGNFVGNVAGLAVSVGSLGIVPLYKTIRDIYKSVKKNN